MRIQFQLAEYGIDYVRGSIPAKSNGAPLDKTARHKVVSIIDPLRDPEILATTPPSKVPRLTPTTSTSCGIVCAPLIGTIDEDDLEISDENRVKHESRPEECASSSLASPTRPPHFGPCILSTRWADRFEAARPLSLPTLSLATRPRPRGRDESHRIAPLTHPGYPIDELKRVRGRASATTTQREGMDQMGKTYSNEPNHPFPHSGPSLSAAEHDGSRPYRRRSSQDVASGETARDQQVCRAPSNVAHGQSACRAQAKTRAAQDRVEGDYFICTENGCGACLKNQPQDIASHRATKHNSELIFNHPVAIMSSPQDDNKADAGSSSTIYGSAQSHQNSPTPTIGRAAVSPSAHPESRARPASTYRKKAAVNPRTFSSQVIVDDDYSEHQNEEQEETTRSWAEYIRRFFCSICWTWESFNEAQGGHGA
ncbi:hypothetical protein F4821DRAFT_259592 [Hypoxylon rubiginosum]|uniref:Uncharacterized protein n=1 Tax=Hypoxylon rubiginosum TaxID=110542 RepID=A0ACC0D2P9_9PEZI|nr:hypothetical protein F4821DRAFT_259592 [Hypoxylon rubiginosum]